MNTFLKSAAITWLIICGVVIWIACAILGLICAFSGFTFIYWLTPYIGLTASICIIRSIALLYKSNPEESLIKFSEKVIGWFRKIMR
jgi:hypothetical protein